ncbi:hypothetical protein FJZ28_03160 [Candidatus Peregrinibacteria bacterium]|nr:hypothetical protein [Candidatus Peregrinibacteria bacterium]
MALHDVLAAIIAESDRQIASLKAQHERAVADAKAKAKQELEHTTMDLQTKYTEKSLQMNRKARQLADQIRRNALLQCKRNTLDEVYKSVVDRLSAESDAALEPLFGALLSRLSGGEIRPTKKHAALLKKLLGSAKGFTFGESIDAKGGFLCISKTREEDCRLETIVHDILRPHTELTVSTQLFPVSKSS